MIYLMKLLALLQIVSNKTDFFYADNIIHIKDSSVLILLLSKNAKGDLSLTARGN